MGRSRDLHQGILARIELALGDRSWSWLSSKSGIPRSTLASQKGKPRFSVDVLVLIANALDRDVAYFLPPTTRHPVRGATSDVLDKIRDLLEQLDASA